MIGDLTGIRENIKYGKKCNQKLYQWTFSRIAQLITYKAELVGIKVVSESEAWTSRTCPQCGHRKNRVTATINVQNVILNTIEMVLVL